VKSGTAYLNKYRLALQLSLLHGCFTYCIIGGMVSRDSIVHGDCCVIDTISMES